MLRCFFIPPSPLKLITLIYRGASLNYLHRSDPKRVSLRHNHRQVVNGILWILRTGAVCQDLPEGYSKWVHRGNTVLSVAKTRYLETSLISPTSPC
ncbi:transposase [Microcoleus sp. AT3-A2]|uniref:transposase n=1 Tax=Microcoleus sp. AT3-A2 TaxID=2818610 RepID=UPI0040407A7A